MCLGVPMRITWIDGDDALAEFDGVESRIKTPLLESPRVGDHVIVHAGFAIEKLDELEAAARLALFAELAELNAEVHAVGVVSGGGDSGGAAGNAV